MDLQLPSDERRTSLMSVKNATMHEKRTTAQDFAELLVKIPNANQGSCSCKIHDQGFSAESESIDSSLQAVNIRARVNDDFSFPWLFGTGTFSQVAGVVIHKTV